MHFANYQARRAVKLRPYQEKALEEIRAHYAAGTKKVLLHLPTGSGKTLCFSYILKSVHEKGNKAFMVVSGASLVDQASVRLDREQVPHGCIQAGHWRNFSDLPIQVCSIHTLYRRKILPEASLIVIDEAHLASSPMFHWLIKHYPNAFILAVTATPYVRKGLRHIADVVVAPISMKELVDQGFLAPARYYVPSKIDLSRVEIDRSTRDYKQDQLAATMKDARLYADIIQSYKKIGKGRPTLCFAVSLEHSMEIVDSFNIAGIRAVHIEAGTPEPIRRKAIEDLRCGIIEVISNVGILTTGVDIPEVSCIIMARPTKSYNLYCQILGRGTRIYPGKSDFIILDHADTISEHGLIDTPREVDLDGVKSRPKEDQVIICERCFSAYRYIENGVRVNACPYCGFSPKAIAKEPAAARNTETDNDVELVEIKTIEEFKALKVEKFIREKIQYARRKNYKKGWVYYQVKNKYGAVVAKNSGDLIEAGFVSVESRPSGIEDCPSFE
jgi:superfamily II DNA or RNA helicase